MIAKFVLWINTNFIIITEIIYFVNYTCNAIHVELIQLIWTRYFAIYLLCYGYQKLNSWFIDYVY